MHIFKEKRSASFFMVLILVLVFVSSCAKEDTAVTEPAEYDVFFEYENAGKNDNAVLMSQFAVDSDLSLYTVSLAAQESENGTHTYRTVLTKYDMNGEIIGEFFYNTLEFPNSAFDIENDKIYGLITENGKMSFVCTDLRSGEKEPICQLSTYSSLDKTVIYENNAYLIGISRDRSGVECDFDDAYNGLPQYEYKGEKLIKIDLSTGEITESPVDFPISFSVYKGRCYVYAADSDGYYFSDFGNKEKHRHSVRSMTGFDMISDDSFVFTSSFSSDRGKLCAGFLDESKGTAQILDTLDSLNMLPDGPVISKNGYTFMRTSISTEDSDVSGFSRIYNGQYIKDNYKIKFISHEVSFDMPFGCGYSMEYKELSGDEFALSVLSQDKDYDMCIVNSYQSYASSIRDKGSFYPLEDLPNVREYIESCFPCIKEAAANDRGEIWMIPVAVNTPLILCNKAVCEKNGIKMPDKMGLKEFIAACEKISENNKSDGISVHPYGLVQNLLIRYLSENDTFDTEQFRDIAVFLKEKINISKPVNYPAYLPVQNKALEQSFFDGSYDNVLFATTYNIEPMRSYAETDVFNAFSMPYFSDGKNAATCVFITVNPFSENLSSALDYISSLCGYLIRQKNTFLLSDNSTYTNSKCITDILKILDDSKICFNISEEIVFNDLLKYMSGDTELDEFIKESDRKLKAYLNE